ncbi:hypothetical protein C8D77_111206 [Mesorhizobium loti]|uniref:Uncharacterized protein n=1 Tax=Rhizobium loti TaxID=381 RepID=A0A8E3B329_RHILI|nr:hypothetical protein C8D77_111206 [Mesorhizobium loti]
MNGLWNFGSDSAQRSKKLLASAFSQIMFGGFTLYNLCLLLR